MQRSGAEMHYRMCGVVQTGFHRRQGSQPNTAEVDMFARKVATRLKPNSLTRFTNLMEGEILPWLRTQEGFLDLIILAVLDGREVATISFWDHEGNAQAYKSSGYPEVLKILGKLLDGTPYVKTFDVVSSTFQRVALAQPPEAENLVQETGSSQLGYRSYETSV
jgi:heme-degrading monooxygenase HmoA